VGIWFQGWTEGGVSHSLIHIELHLVAEPVESRYGLSAECIERRVSLIPVSP
jgi:hypothetical protein